MSSKYTKDTYDPYLEPPIPLKAYIPLESNPEVFTQLLHNLGAPSLEFHDVFSIDDPDLMAIVPRPVLALVLVFPTSETYEKQKEAEEAMRTSYEGFGPEEDVNWFKQTIHNACGFYGILHAISNGPARDFIEPDSILSRLMAECIPCDPDLRAMRLEFSDELETAYKVAALQGQSAAPEDANAEVDFHYIAFVRSHKNGRLYEMDGDKKGPIDLGIQLTEGKDMLEEEAVLGVVRKFMAMEKEDLRFSLMALTSKET